MTKEAWYYDEKQRSYSIYSIDMKIPKKRNSLDDSYNQKLSDKVKQEKKLKKRFLSFKSFAIAVNIFIILICTATLVYQASQCIMRWLGEETKAILSVKRSGEATFLALSICPRFEEAYNLTYMSEIGITKDDFKKGNFFGNSPESDGFKVFQKVSFGLQEIMSIIEISTASVNHSKILMDFSNPLEDFR